MRKIIEAQINEISKLELMNQNKKEYEYVLKNADKLVKDKIDNAISTSIILRWIKGRNWEGGLGSGKDVDKLFYAICNKFNVDFDDVYDRFNKLMDFWDNEFKKAKIVESRKVIEAYVAEDKSLSKMNTNELRDLAVSMGMDEKELHGTSKQSLIILIDKIQKSGNKPETYSIVRIVDVGDFSNDKMEIGELEGTIQDIKKKASKKYGKVKKVDYSNKEIVVEAYGVVDTDLSQVYSVWHKGQRTNGKLFNDLDRAEKYAKKEVSRLKSAKMNMPKDQREVYISKGDDILKVLKVNEE